MKKSNPKFKPRNWKAQGLAAFLITLLAATLPAFAQHDPLVDDGFVDGVKEILFDEGRFPVIHVDMTAYDSADRGIPDAVMKLAGYPLDMDVDTTMLGGISIYDRYRWGLSITDESTAGDGISDLVKMRPPGWNDKQRSSRVFFTAKVEEDAAEATPFCSSSGHLCRQIALFML